MNRIKADHNETTQKRRQHYGAVWIVPSRALPTFGSQNFGAGFGRPQLAQELA